MLEDGIISKKDYDVLLNLQRESQEVNLGYAFVTYSHSDESKIAIIMAHGMEVEGQILELSVKNDQVDHKDLDIRYTMNK
jgi:hypothetical protein